MKKPIFALADAGNTRNEKVTPISRQSPSGWRGVLRYFPQQPQSGTFGLQSQPLGVNWAAGKGMRLNISQGSSAQPGESQHSFVGML